MYNDYKDSVDFLFIYIKEAHPLDKNGATIPKNKGVAELKDPSTAEERVKNANICKKSLALTLPNAIDGIDNKTCEDYAAWPERLYLIGTDGRVLFRGEPGPARFDPAALDAAIRKHVSAAASAPASRKAKKT
ncbi:MAG: hypothetical protein HY286_13430 [Planctomycetes bacterium]|nr:hypothetical protein [Planctomycetota bacterium]